MATAVYGRGKPVASLGFLGWGRQSRRLDSRRYRQNGEHRALNLRTPAFTKGQSLVLLAHYR